MEERRIKIGIDTYDDLFSDFDSRSYEERSFSDDFIAELKKVCQEKKESISELKLQLPSGIRNSSEEETISKRIHLHIKGSNAEFNSRQRRLRRRAVLFLIVGFSMMITASLISLVKNQLIVINILFVIVEPAGWFLVWTGFDLLFYSVRRFKTELEFYQKLSKSKIQFESI